MRIIIPVVGKDTIKCIPTKQLLVDFHCSPYLGTNNASTQFISVYIDLKNDNVRPNVVFGA
jgi:hypothetical protein